MLIVPVLNMFATQSTNALFVIFISVLPYFVEIK